MDKIKAFFTNKITKFVCWLVLVASAAGLIIGGATLDEINSGVALTGGIITAVALLITFISTQVHKD